MDNVPIKERAKLAVAQDMNIGAYSQTPIHSFGMNMLKMMGFSQEKGLGARNQKNALPEILVLKPRPKGLGLGADPNGLQQNQVEFEEIYKPGSKVKIVQGPHRELVGIILKSELESDVLLVQLELSEQNVKVTKQDVQKYTESAEKRAVQEEEQLKQHKKKRLKWVIPGITVKIVDKSSPYYLQKVKVLQITGQKSFECQTDSKKILTDLTEKGIQTVIPKTDDLVIVLKGEHRGTKAKLKQRWKKEQNVMVQTVDELQMLKFHENDVCAYQD